MGNGIAYGGLSYSLKSVLVLLFEQYSDKQSLNCNTAFNTTVTLTAKDENDRTAICTSEARLIDDMPPNAVCNAGVLMLSLTDAVQSRMFVLYDIIGASLCLCLSGF